MSVRQAETWLQLLLNQMEDDRAVFLLDRRGRVMSWNTGVQRVLGYDNLEFLSLPFEDLFGSDNKAAAQRAIDQARTTGHAAASRSHLRKGGGEVWMRGVLMALRDHEHQLRGYAYIMRDRTAEERAAGERDELIRREQVARADAERANRTKEAFLTAVSHELRTPLNAILGWGQLLSTGHLSGDATIRGLQIILRNGKAQAQLIDDLLGVSRIVSGTFELDLQPLNLGSVVKEAVESVRPTARAKRLRLSLSSPDLLPPIEGDGNHLRQVLVKILDNAVQFTPPEGTITVTVGRTHHEAEVTVCDTGKGISSEALPHIFDRLYEGGEPGRHRRGLGLGLAIARHVIEAHRGSIGVDSAGEGKGCAVTLRLPFALDPRTAIGVNITPAAFDEACAPVLAGRRALVVEDQPDWRELLEMVLTRFGVRVFAVGSVQEALEALDRQPIDVIISDIGLEGEDGLALMRYVREHLPDRRRSVPAIAVSAYAGARDRARALEAGFQKHLAKPVDPGEVIAAVAALVSLHDVR
ncbi:MAG TPA: ATP-binding protein [Vicinamibacterales bacterium]|nr:ATP-binding protein [Vicinamibacterales bacterium]